MWGICPQKIWLLYDTVPPYGGSRENPAVDVPSNKPSFIGDSQLLLCLMTPVPGTIWPMDNGVRLAWRNLHMYPTTSHISQTYIDHHKMMYWSNIVLLGKLEGPVWYIMMYHSPIKVVQWAEPFCFINQAVGKPVSFTNLLTSHMTSHKCQLCIYNMYIHMYVYVYVYVYVYIISP